LSTNPSGVPAISTSGYQPPTPEQIDAMTLADVDVELDRLRVQIAARPRLYDVALIRAVAAVDPNESDEWAISYAVMEVLKRAAADASFLNAVIVDYRCAGMDERAEQFTRAVRQWQENSAWDEHGAAKNAEVSAR
jgi:hypothetical protein